MGSGEVICCAGVFETPKILYNSLTLAADNKDAPVLGNIGKNLQDHTVLPVIFIGNWNLENLKLGIYDNERELCMHPIGEPSNGVHGWINLNEIFLNEFLISRMIYCFQKYVSYSNCQHF